MCIGLVGRAMMPTQFATQAAAENIFIVVSQALLPSFMCGIVVSGIFAASMSSSSSYMIIGASAVGENIFRGLLHRKATDKQVMIVARVTLVVMFLFGILVAYDQNSSIFQVVSYAWAGLGASFGPLMLCSLYWRRANKAGAWPACCPARRPLLIWHNLVKPLGGIFAIYELLPASSSRCCSSWWSRCLRPRQARKCCTNSTTISTIRTTATWTTTSWPQNRRRGEALADLNRPAVGVAPPATPKVGLWYHVACLWQIPTTGKCQVACLWHLIQETPCMSIGIPTDIHGVSRFPCHK